MDWLWAVLRGVALCTVLACDLGGAQGQWQSAQFVLVWFLLVSSVLVAWIKVDDGRS
jgi:hypothetical protein